MFILDDLLFRPFVGIVDALHTIALDEMYDVEGLEAELKENQLLYELGERSEAEYRRRKDELEAELETAREVHEQLSSGRVEVKNDRQFPGRRPRRIARQRPIRRASNRRESDRRGRSLALEPAVRPGFARRRPGVALETASPRRSNGLRLRHLDPIGRRPLGGRFVARAESVRRRGSRGRNSDRSRKRRIRSSGPSSDHHVAIRTHEDELLVTADVAGADPDDVTVGFDDSMLVIVVGDPELDRIEVPWRETESQATMNNGVLTVQIRPATTDQTGTEEPEGDE